jgi:alpha-beta hydrolase superfamily lysophospholipase
MEDFMFYNVFTKKVPSSDGVNTLCGKVYVPVGEVKALFQVVHGMAEHIERYDEFMGFMADNGYVVFAYDHVGHGETGAKAGHFGYISDKFGYKTLVDDIHVFAEAVKADFPGKKHILMGHSMGSFAARIYAARYGKELAGLIPMGTGGYNPVAKIGILLTKTIKEKFGSTYISDFVNDLIFGSYNARTEKDSNFNWLSENKENVEKYESDEFCGYPFTVSAMQDLITLTYLANTNTVARETPKNLPIFLVAGAEDPVGAYGEGVKRVGFKLHQKGVKDVKFKLYKDARHEILNDFCKEEVFCDILAFAKRVI